MPLLQLIRRKLVPSASTGDLAEVIVGGLFRPQTRGPGGDVLRFRSGVRARLREILSESDAWRTYEVLKQHITGGAGQLATFDAAVPDPSGNIAIPADLQQFAAASREALQFLGALPESTPDQALITIPPQAGDRTNPLIWGNVPLRDPYFTGREAQFGELRSDRSSRITAVLPHALHGLGGIGKTAMAVEYAHRYRNEYELVCWIPSGEPALVPASLAELAGPLGLEAAAAIGIDNAAAAVLDALRRGHPYSRWLLIFDRADQPEDLAQIMLPGPGDTLITSQNHRWQAVTDTVQEDVFTRAESREFLIRRVPGGLHERDADRLAEELGDFPLALALVGAFLAETGMPVAEYLRLLEENLRRILAESPSSDYPLPLTTALPLSVSALRERSPQAIEVLRCLAFFGPEPVPLDVFPRGAEIAELRVRDVITDPIMLAKAIRELARFGLVALDAARQRIWVHSMLQALVRDYLADDQERASYQHQAHGLLAAAAPGDPRDTNQWPRYRELVAHLTPTKLEECHVPEVRAFVLDALRYLYLCGDLRCCRSFAERFIARWTDDSGPDDPNVLAAQYRIGSAIRELGRYQEAYEIDEATRLQSERVLGRFNLLTLALSNSFGQDLRIRGEFASALTLDEESLLSHEEKFGRYLPQTLRVMSNLALDYLLNSRYREARDLSENVHRLRSESTAEVSAIELVTSWTILASAVRLCGDYIQARDMSEEVWDYGRERLGPSHYATLRAANALSIALRRTGTDYEEALGLARQIFENSSRILGQGHPDTMAARISLANALRTTGRLREALELADTISIGYGESYGMDHPFSFGGNGNLALMRRVTGDPDQGRALNEGLLMQLDTRLTRDHHYSLTVAINLASDLAGLGEIDRARALGEDTLTRSERTLGARHPVVLGCAANLVMDLRANGAIQESEELFERTMVNYRETLGDNHPDTITAAEGRRLDFDFDPPPIGNRL
jgi:tetratricopeptide (TPR) repeat protein